jgi:hypothetical protein
MFYTMQKEKPLSVAFRQQCIMCDQHLGKILCSGCQRCFCKTHYNQHQEERVKQIDDITQKHGEFVSQLTAKDMDNNHPLLERINRWERLSIDRFAQWLTKLASS